LSDQCPGDPGWPQVAARPVDYRGMKPLIPSALQLLAYALLLDRDTQTPAAISLAEAVLASAAQQ